MPFGSKGRQPGVELPSGAGFRPALFSRHHVEHRPLVIAALCRDCSERMSGGFSRHRSIVAIHVWTWQGVL
jgi:hypothetical protein